MLRFLELLALLLLLTVPAGIAFGADADADGVDDSVDNCVQIANPGQFDGDGDGFGNDCDGDFNQDGIVNFLDLQLFRAAFLSTDPVRDLNADGRVNFLDLARFRAAFLKPPGPKCASCPLGDPCARAHALLCPGLDVVPADEAFAECLAQTDPQLDPATFQSATFFRGFTRVLRPAFELLPGPNPAQVDSIAEVLDALGVGAAGRDPRDFQATLPLLPSSCTIPEGVRESDVVNGLRTELLPALDAAIASFPVVQTSWQDTCEVDHFGRSELVEFDGSDALLLRAQLHALRAFLHLLEAEDLDFDLGDFCTALREGPLPTIQSFLSDNPTFASRSSAAAAQGAKLDLLESLDLMVDAFAAIRAETDDQSDDFAFIDASDPDGHTPEAVANVESRIAFARASLLAPTLIPPDLILSRSVIERGCIDSRTFLAAYFDSYFDGAGIRATLPPFVGNDPDVDALPDPTFGGILPDQQGEPLRCLLDDDSPVIQFDPGYGPDFEQPVLTQQPVRVRIEIRDEPVGASPGSEIDPSSIFVVMSVHPIGAISSSDRCTVRLNGETVAADSVAVVVTDLFTMGPDAGGWTLEADLEIDSTPAFRGCAVFFSVDASDAFGHTEYGFQGLDILERGPTTRVTPAFHRGPSPVALVITLGAPFGDVNLDEVRIVALQNIFDLPCPEIRVNGQPLAFPPAPFGQSLDVTELMTRESGPGPGERTFRGTISTVAPTRGCHLSVQAKLSGPPGTVLTGTYLQFLP